MHSYDDLGNGEVIVLLHGLGNRKEAWVCQHALSEHYRLIIPDIIGHGNSPVSENINLRHAVEDIMALLDELQIEEFSVCGLSLGGIIAQQIYFKHPNRVNRLILANTCSYMPLIPTHLIAATQKNYLKQHETVHFKELSIKHCLYERSEPNVTLANQAFYIDENTYPASCRMGAGINYYPLLYSIKVPVLIITSTHDKVIHPSFSYSMRLFIRQSKLTVIPNAGHLSNIEQPKRFNEELLSFFSHT